MTTTTGRYLHLPPAADVALCEQPTVTPVRLPGSAVGSDEVAETTVAGWLADGRAVESRIEVLAGHRRWVHYETLTRHQAAVYATREALTQTTVPHALTRTCPHPRVVGDIAKQWFGLELTAAEIHAATIEAMDR